MLMIASSSMAERFRCPHCGRTFAKKYVLVRELFTSFVRRCVHCGIAMGTPRCAVEPTSADHTL
jgi:hypothetical protein